MFFFSVTNANHCIEEELGMVMWSEVSCLAGGSYASFTEGSAPGNTADRTRTNVVLVSAVAQCPRSLRSRLRSRITECFSFLLIRP